MVTAAPAGMEACIEHTTDRLLRMWQVGVRESAKGGCTGSFGHQPEENPHSGGLPCPIGTQEAGHTPGLDHEAEIVYGERAVVALDQPINDDRRNLVTDSRP